MRGSFITKAFTPCTLLALLLCLALAPSSIPAPTDNATDNRDLLGQWEGYVFAGNGTSTGQRRVNISLTITPDRIICKDAENTGEGTYRLAPGHGNLRNLDATGLAGFYKGHLYEGIVSVEGDTLKWCCGDPGKGRPTEFRTVNSKGHFLMILTRKKQVPTGM